MRRTPEVSIVLKDERPRSKLKLVITADETSELEIGKEEPSIQWFGMLCEYTSLRLRTY